MEEKAWNLSQHVIANYGLAGLFAIALIAVIAWLLAKTIPSMLQESKEQRKSNEETIARLIQAFRDENNLERTECRERHKEMLEAVGKMHNDMNAQLKDQQDCAAEEFQQLRHGVADLAHAAGLKKAVEDMQAKRGTKGLPGGQA